MSIREEVAAGKVDRLVGRKDNRRDDRIFWQVTDILCQRLTNMIQITLNVRVTDQLIPPVNVKMGFRFFHKE